MDEIWDIFNTCRQYHREKYVNSEIYNSMMRKIRYLCKEENELQAQRDRLRKVIEEDTNRIIKDAYFYTSQYCFFPEKQIVDGNGNISTEFKRDLLLSGISKLKPLNNVLLALIREYDFDVVWKFYEFIVENYEQSGKRKELRPDIRTVTYLIEAAKNKEHFEKAEAVSKLWCAEQALRTNKIYCDAYVERSRVAGAEKHISVHKERVKQEVKSQNFTQRADDVVEMAKKDIHYYGSLTSTLLNKYLDKVIGIMDDIGRSHHLSREQITRCKLGTYFNVRKNLIDAFSNQISFDALSYVYLVRLSQDNNEVERWMKELRAKENIYKYDMVVCAVISQSKEVCKADIDMALDYFEFWEDIIDNIGYDPDDQTSFSEHTERTYYEGVEEYDGYWINRAIHSTNEMGYYYHRLHKYGKVDDVALRFLKRQMDLFDKYGVPFPRYYSKNQAFDFQKEIEAHKDLLNEN